MSVELTKEIIVELMERNGKYVGTSIAEDFGIEPESEELANVLAKAYKELAMRCQDLEVLNSSSISFTRVSNTIRLDIYRKDTDDWVFEQLVLDTKYDVSDTVLEAVKGWMYA